MPRLQFHREPRRLSRFDQSSEVGDNASVEPAVINRARPGLREALAACRAGDELVVTKLDRLAHSLPDARGIVDELTKREVKLNLGGSIHDPNDPVGRLLFVLAMVAEFESDLIRMPTKEGLEVAEPPESSAGASPSSARAKKPTSSPSTAAER